MNGPVVVTGGAGSVGRLLVQRCLAHGHRVRVFDLPGCDFSGLEGQAGVEICRGDITDAAAVRQAVRGAGAVVHLAALLPPASERDRARTFAINVQGTAHVVEAMAAAARDAVLVFSSSVSTYGDTTAATPPIRVTHPQAALDVYAESKIAAERLVRQAPRPALILRIAGIAVPALQEPPEEWPFTAEQRLEMVHRDDVVTALYHALVTPQAWGLTLNIAGGPSWQLTGRQYVADLYALLGVPLELARFRDPSRPGWVDWYDTEASQRLLRYQDHPYPAYLEALRAEVARLLAE
ncbi:MAG: hypothetical protein KatS3mg131_0914 [Candidatus Tectimicrobiota bacterium]|nr:MAG: hypothetical protein KatS3mg131_0914 [Candidatus Tectomicrobia bacterium]